MDPVHTAVAQVASVGYDNRRLPAVCGLETNDLSCRPFQKNFAEKNRSARRYGMAGYCRTGTQFVVELASDEMYVVGRPT